MHINKSIGRSCNTCDEFNEAFDNTSPGIFIAVLHLGTDKHNLM